MTQVEPYLADSSGFPRMQVNDNKDSFRKWNQTPVNVFQMLTYSWYFVPYYGMAIYGLLNPGKSWMLDWAMIHAGAAAQVQHYQPMTSIVGITIVGCSRLSSAT